MKRSAIENIVAMSSTGTRTARSGPMIRDIASVRATGEVVNVRSDVPTTSSTIRATKNAPVARPAPSTPTGPTRTSASSGRHLSALASSVNASSSATARRPRSAMRSGTREAATAPATTTAATAKPVQSWTLNSRTVYAATSPSLARGSRR